MCMGNEAKLLPEQRLAGDPPQITRRIKFLSRVYAAFPVKQQGNSWVAYCRRYDWSGDEEFHRELFGLMGQSDTFPVELKFRADREDEYWVTYLEYGPGHVTMLPDLHFKAPHKRKGQVQGLDENDPYQRDENQCILRPNVMTAKPISERTYKDKSRMRNRLEQLSRIHQQNGWAGKTDRERIKALVADEFGSLQAASIVLGITPEGIRDTFKNRKTALRKNSKLLCRLGEHFADLDGVKDLVFAGLEF